MSIASEIARLQQAKTAIKAAINEKGGTITNENIADYAAFVDSLELGGGSLEGQLFYADVFNNKYVETKETLQASDTAKLIQLSYVLDNDTTSKNKYSNQVYIQEYLGLTGIDKSKLIVGTSEALSHGISTLLIKGTTLFVTANNTLYKYKVSDFTKIDEVSLLNIVHCACNDLSFLYYGLAQGKVRKLVIGDLSLPNVFEYTTASGHGIYAITIDDTHIYCGGTYGDSKIYQLLKNDLSLVSTSGFYNDGLVDDVIYAISNDATHVYIGGTLGTIKKYDKTDLSLVVTSANYGGVIRALTLDKDYVYVVGSITNTIQKYLKTDLSYLGESSTYGDTVKAILLDGDYIYITGDNTGIVQKYLKSDLSFVGETGPQVSSSQTLVVDKCYLYSGENGIAPFTFKAYVNTVSNLIQTRVELI